jgi:signal recognition particle subunit SRP54
MGDVVSLVEKVQAHVDQEKALKLGEKLAKETFSLADFLEQLQQVKKMGPLSEILALVPGMPAGGLPPGAADEKGLKRTEAILQSMTAKERRLPQILDGGRRRRVARGSGTTVEEVNRLLKQFEQMKKMMKQMRKGRRGAFQRMMPGMGFPGF